MNSCNYHCKPKRLQASSKKSRSMVSSPTFSRNFLIDFSSSSLFPSPLPPNAFSMFLIASCFHCDIWLGLTSNSFDSSASVFCSLIAAKATMALNLFVNFLRLVVIFPNAFIPCKTAHFSPYLLHSILGNIIHEFSNQSITLVFFMPSISLLSKSIVSRYLGYESRIFFNDESSLFKVFSSLTV